MNSLDEVSPDELKNEYDIVIVGAGPAGCTAAKLLSKKYSVLLVERSAIPRVKPCGGMLVEESREVIEKLNPPSHVFTTPKHTSIEYRDLDNGITAKTGRKILNVYRGAFDYWLFNDAAESDFDFLSNTSLESFTQHEKDVKITLSKGKRLGVKTRWLVDASGGISSIRGKIAKQPRFYTAVQKYCKTDADASDITYFVFDNTLTDFYGWVIPKQIYSVIGIAYLPTKGNILDQFLNRIQGFVKACPCFETEAHVLTRPDGAKDVCFGKGSVFLVGEAAGLVSPSFGEGISFALRSAQELANALNKSPENALEAYKQRCEHLKREIEGKHQKALALSDPAQRKKLLGSLSK